MADYVNVRAYAELNDFLGPESRGVTARRPFRPHQTVKGVLDAMGIPLVRSDLPEEQTLEVIRRLDLRQRLAPFTRCVRCNARLVAVSKDEVIDHLQPLTRRYYDDFSRGQLSAKQRCSIVAYRRSRIQVVRH